MVLCSGCWSTKPGENDEILSPDSIPEDMPLGARQDYGRAVTRGECDSQPVYFGFDSYQVADSELAKLAVIASFMNRNRDTLLVVEGNCDERGSNEYNISLGEHRALAVRLLLVRNGVASSRIQTRSFGEELPADPGHNERAWRFNRRANFALYRKR
ncbi:MAG: OmpA family protein [Kiritimatiellae bacterium]|nr:OmpA family protein [Kiritimatiellia bacterium]